MKGYKAFNRIEGSTTSGECRGMIYEEGKVYEIEEELQICKNGLHFCEHLVQTFEYYEYDYNQTIYAEVEALGDIDVENNLRFKLATNKLKIVKFLSDVEVDAFFQRR